MKVVIQLEPEDEVNPTMELLAFPEGELNLTIHHRRFKAVVVQYDTTAKEIRASFVPA